MEETFKTVAVYTYSAQAHIIKGKLESEGIEVFLFDEFTIDTDPLVSNAIGGVKVKVLSSQEKQAKEIIDLINRYSIDDKGDKINCPNCKSDKINYYTTVKENKSMFWFLIGLLITSLPFYVKNKYRCEDCKTEFEK